MNNVTLIGNISTDLELKQTFTSCCKGTEKCKGCSNSKCSDNNEMLF